MAGAVELAARLCYLGASVDLTRLYEAEDREYVLFLRALLERMSELRHEENEANKRGT